MKKAFRIALGTAVLAGGLAVAGASPANAQVRFRGSFPLPHGRISIGVGDYGYGGYGYGGFGVGAYVPYGYNVYDNPEYGYGFEYDNYWYPCEQYGTQWVISGAPVFFQGDYGYVRPYRSYGYGYARPYANYGYRYSQPYRNYGYRNYRRDDRRNWDGRNSRTWNGRDSRRDNRGSRDRNRDRRW